MSTDDWIQIYVAASRIEANVAASALEHAGISTQLRPADSSGFGAALPTLQDSSGVWVRPRDVDRALELIASAGDSAVGQLSLAPSNRGEVGFPDE